MTIHSFVQISSPDVLCESCRPIGIHKLADVGCCVCVFSFLSIRLSLFLVFLYVLKV